MSQILIVDQRAMAEQAMANLLRLIAQQEEYISRSRPDLNRRQRRAFETKLVPIRRKLVEMRKKQAELDAKIKQLAEAEFEKELEQKDV